MAHVVGRSNGNAILIGMPAHVQDLLIEIDLLRVRLLLHATARPSRAAGPGVALLSIGPLVHRRGNADLLRLESRLVRLQYNLRLLGGVCGVDHKIVVVASGHDIFSIAGEDHFKFIEDTVVLVRVAQTGPQMFVDRNRLHRLSLHVHVPNLHRQVVPGHDVATVV